MGLGSTKTGGIGLFIPCCRFWRIQVQRAQDNQESAPHQATKNTALSFLKKHRKAQLEERMKLGELFADQGLMFAS